MPDPRPALELPGYVDGIDVSRVQTIADPEAVYRAGFRFAFAKVSEGLTYCDPRALDHMRRLRDAGLYVGTYGFARVQAGDPRAQARQAVDGCAAVGVGTEHVVRPVLDLETAPDGWSADAMLAFADAWLDEVRLTGALPVLYTYTSFAHRLSGTPTAKAALACLLDETPLWLAQYRSTTSAWAPTSEADMPRVPWRWDLLQYSGDGGYPVPGIPGATDRNLFRGDESALRAWFGLPVEAEPEPIAITHGSHVVDGALDDRRHGPFSE